MSEPEPPEHVAVFRRLRQALGDPSLRGRDAQRRRAARSRGRDDESATPFGTGRDPRGLGDVVEQLTAQLGWDSPLERAELTAAWAELVGPDNAAHSAPAGIEEGVLTVRCDSTAWAQQLRLMRAAVLTRITERYPAAGIDGIRFTGPDVPSWKKGPRSVPGRGPRDTYG